MVKSVGKLFRRVVIDADLKSNVNTILRASSPDEPVVVAARRRIREMVTPEKTYLFASEIRGYLEEKTRIGTEPWVFPVAGDLFLDALEANLASVGPNLFVDHYSGMLGCYRDGDQPSKAIEGPLYCAELALQRIVMLYARDDQQAEPEGKSLSFEVDHASDRQGRFRQFLALAERALGDAVDATSQAERGEFPASFMETVVEAKARNEAAIIRWRKHHAGLAQANLSGHDYLLRTLEVAKDAEHPPLVASILDELGAWHVESPQATNKEDPPHPVYDAGRTLLVLGNRERGAQAFDLAIRRYRRARALFGRIEDRTAEAKALVEHARAAISQGDDIESARRCLYEGVRLVMAHMANLPHGTVPSPTSDAVVRFLESKGYVIEAQAYAAAEQVHDPFGAMPPTT